MLKSYLKLSILAIGVMFNTLPGMAHEFWVAPENYTPQSGVSVAVGLKVGQMMEGQDYPFLSDKFQSFTITSAKGTRNAEGVEGDIPALTYKPDPGLNIIAHHALAFPITFDTFAEFSGYLIYEGLGAVATSHRSRGLPETGITERYIRCAKALLQVGPLAESDVDKPVGLPFELITEINPYTPGLTTLPVKLIWKGKPVTGRQISIFRNDGQVTRTLITTDGDGRASIPLNGGGQFLLNAVQMDPLEKAEVMWESHWASLTFGLPVPQ